MSLQILKEKLSKGCVGVSGGIDLVAGVLAGGKNVRRADVAGGWRGRKGNTLRNLEALPSSPNILNQFAFINPFTEKLHLLTQAGGKLYDAESTHSTLKLDSGNNLLLNGDELLLIDADGDEPYEQQEDLGFDVGVSVSSSVPGFGTVLRDRFFYSDPTSGLITSCGLGCFVTGFFFEKATDDTSTDYDVLKDGLANVSDGRDDTASVFCEEFLDTAPPYITRTHNLYVCSPERSGGFWFKFDDASVPAPYCSDWDNDTTVFGSVYAWRNGAWAEVSNISKAVYCLGEWIQDGWVTFDESNLDDMKVIGGIQGYWYKFVVNNVAGQGVFGDDPITVSEVKTKFSATSVTNKWDGIWAYPTGFLYYNGTTYVDYLGRLTNESESQYVELDSAGAANTIHIKSEQPLTGFGFGIIPGKGNGNAETIASISHNGTNVSDVVDGTEVGGATLAQTGHVFFDASSITPRKTLLGGDKIPGYWYTIILSGALDAEVELYLCVVAKAPESLPKYKGVVTFDDRLVAWGDPRYPNRLRVSPAGFPDFLGGPADNYSDPAGDITAITRVVPYGAYLIVFKRSGVWLCNRDLVMSQVTTEVGLNALFSVQVSEVGTSSMTTDQVKNIVVWADIDGCYMFDLSAVRKISLPVDHYFNPRYEGSWPDDGRNLANLVSYNDVVNNEYHLIEPTSGEELVFTYAFEQWYPIWERCDGWKITSGLTFKYDGSYYLLAGTDAGLCLLLESGESDIGVNNEHYVIEQQILTRLIAPEESQVSLQFDLKEFWFLLASSDDFTVNEFLCSLYENYSSSASIADFVVNASGSAQYNCVRVAMARQRLIAFQLLVEMTRDLIPADTDIFGWWPGSPGFGTTAIDCSGEGNNGTLMNGVAWGTGDVGKCFEFDGTDDYIDLGVQGITGSKTISAWIYVDETAYKANSYYIVDDHHSSNSGFLLRIDGADEALDFMHFPATTQTLRHYLSGHTILQTWVHVAATYDLSTTTAKLYLNGVPVGNPDTTFTDNPAGTRNLVIGNYTYSPAEANAFKGKIAEVRIYERALSEAEILGLATNPLGRLAHIRELMYSIEQRRVIT